VNGLDLESRSVQRFRRTFALLAAMLLMTAAAACWLVPLLAPFVPVPVLALLGGALVTVLCMPLLWYGTSRLADITNLPERMCAEAIVRHAPEGILTIDKRGQVLSLNPAAERFFGYRADEVVHEPITLLLAEPPPPERRNLLNDTLPVGTILGLAAGAREVIGKRKNGETFPLELTGSSLTLGDEPVSVAFARDISKRKRAQRYLTAHYAATCILAEARSLTEALPRVLQAICETLCWEVGTYWRFDPEDGVLRCAEMHEAPFLALRPGPDAEPPACRPDQGLIGRAWSTGRPSWVEDVQGVQDGPSLALAGPRQLRGAFAFPIVLGEEVCGVVTFFSSRKLRRDELLQDIMVGLGRQLGQFIARKRDEERLQRSEDQLRQAQKMEAIGRLAGGVAHDFNNLLTVITGYSEMLLAEAEPGGPAQEYLEQIKEAGKRAASLTRQLLAFGRKQVLQAQVLDLNAVVQNLVKMLRRLIGEDIEIVVRQDPRLGRVKADPVQIEQILLNLATNARDAMPEGGTLTVTTANVEVGSPGPSPSPDLVRGPCVMLAVSDTGCGMDEGSRRRLFEPFFTTKERGKGTGLGLATVYGIVKQSRGHIEVDSEPGRGATFRIYLPRLEEADPGCPDPQGPSDAPRGQETILLVEDEEGVRKLVSHTLRLSGYTVLEASSGAEALKLCERHSGAIALLVTDVIMPQMNGRELAERAVSLLEDLKVLYISGYTDPVLDDQGFLAPGTAFLEKPITPGALARKVREVLDAPSGNGVTTDVPCGCGQAPV
jgi:PAS domain S-box-containing protein